MERIVPATGARLNRRAALRLLTTSAGIALLAACTPSTASPTSAPAPKPTEALQLGVARAATTPPGATATVLVQATTTPTPAAQPKSGGLLRMAILGDLPNLESHLLNQNAY